MAVPAMVAVRIGERKGNKKTPEPREPLRPEVAASHDSREMPARSSGE